MFIHLFIPLREAAEHHFHLPFAVALPRRGGEEFPDFAEGDAGGGFEGVAVDAGGDAGEGDGAAGVVGGEGEGVAVAGGELFGFAAGAAAPDGSDGVDDPAGGKAEAGRDAGFAGGTAHAGTDFGDRKARLVEVGARGAVDGAVHATAAQHPLVRGVDDGIDGKGGDVGVDDFDHGLGGGCFWTGFTGFTGFFGGGWVGEEGNLVNLVNPVEKFIWFSCRAGICV